MEEVLRKYYHKQYNDLQRRRIQKTIQDQNYYSNTRKKYDFREDYTLRTPATQLTDRPNSRQDYDQVRFEKELQQAQKKIMKINPMIQARYNSLKLPDIVKKRNQISKKAKRLFRKAVFAIMFINHINRSLKQLLLKRKKRMEKYAKVLIQTIQKIVQTYYQQLFQEELTQYMNILVKILNRQAQNIEKDIVQILHSMAYKLSSSTITKDLLQFFILTTTNLSFLPSDFLSAIEIYRLQFSPTYGCLVNVSFQQTKMIVAATLGIKIFCYYILYKPWTLANAPEQLKQNYLKIHSVISSFSSIFYFILLEQSCLKIAKNKNFNKETLQTFNIRSCKQFDPYGISIKGKSNKSLIAGQSRQFLNEVEISFPGLIGSIKKYLNKWISRITLVILKENEKRGKFYLTNNSEFRTLQSKGRVYKSLELKKDQRYMRRSNSISKQV